MLLAALAFTPEPERDLDHREAHRDHERDLKRAGLIHADGDPASPGTSHAGLDQPALLVDANR